MREGLFKLFVIVQSLRGDSGQDLIEYALLTALVALAAITTVATIGNSVNNIFTTISTSLASAA